MDTQTPFEQVDIFTVLGVPQDDPDREAFLAQMEEAIWEEIVEHELSDKMADADLDQIEAILNDDNTSVNDKRDKLFSILVEKIPEFETVVREYTMAAKTDLLLERVEGLQEYYSQDQAKLEQVNKASGLFDQGEYTACVMALNAIVSG